MLYGIARGALAWKGIESRIQLPLALCRRVALWPVTGRLIGLKTTRLPGTAANRRVDRHGPGFEAAALRVVFSGPPWHTFESAHSPHGSRCMVASEISGASVWWVARIRVARRAIGTRFRGDEVKCTAPASRTIHSHSLIARSASTSTAVAGNLARARQCRGPPRTDCHGAVPTPINSTGRPESRPSRPARYASRTHAQSMSQTPRAAPPPTGFPSRTR